MVKYVQNVQMEKFAILLRSVLVENVAHTFVNVSNFVILFIKLDARRVIVGSKKVCNVSKTP